MAEFESSPVVDSTPTTQVDLVGDLLNAQKLQQNALAAQTTQQDLADRATFRANAAGLAQRDPTATAQALGANPSAALSYLQTIPTMDQNTRLQAASDLAASASLAGSILNAPASQRPALWAQGRQQLIAGGHANVPGEDYPGDSAMLMMRGLGLTAAEQFEKQGQALTTTPQYPLQTIPGGGSVGPGGTTAGPGSGESAAPAGGPPGLAQSESGGDPSAVNRQGFAGSYQFGSGRLADLGMYTPARGEDPNSNAWTGQFNIPGFPQVKTLADFLATPAAQDAAYSAHVDDIDHTIATTPGAQNYDQNGLVAVAHLGGVAGMQRFVATGGKYNPADANGTTLVDYYQKYRSNAPPVQVAANTGTAGVQPTATDASPSPSDAGFQAMRVGLYAPPAPLVSGQPAPPVTGSASPATGGPVNAVPVQPSSTAPAVPRSIASSDSPSGTKYTLANTSNGPTPNILAAGPSMAPVTGQLAPSPLPVAPPPNALATMPTPSGQPSPPAWNALAGPPPSGAPASGMQPLFSGNTYVPAPNLPGYIMGVDARGQRGVMRVPGAPPPKAPDTKFVGGTMIQTDGSTGDVLRVVPNMVPDPSRTAQVTGAGPNGQNGTTLFQDGKPIGFVPASTQPIQMEAYKSDLARAGQIAQQATDSEQQVQRALEARNYAQGLPTGAGGEDRAALSTWLKTYAPDPVYQGFVKSGYLPDAPQAESAAKVMLAQAALDEKTMGGSGGLGLTEKYAKANPSLNMTPQAIQAMSNLKAVTAQSAKDYADGYLQYFNNQAQTFAKAGGSYQPAAAFDEAWHSQPNVQRYMAAIGAMNGEPYSVWSKGLSPQVQRSALGVVSRVDPTSIVNGANGRIRVDGQPQQPGAGGQSAAPSAPSAPTATGPNGQKLILRNGAWAPL